MSLVGPGFEAERRLRAGFIGCGSHSFRNVYPVLAWAPVDLVAVCDRDEEKAAAYARQFGALRSYGDHRAMFDAEDLDCVFIVTGYDKAGRITHADLAVEALARGIATWVEKPPVNSLDDVAAIREAMAVGGAQYAVGLKKAFAPGNRKAKALADDPDFGPVRLISARYAQAVPDFESATDMQRVMFLDHLCHPMSVLQFLGGPAVSLFYRRTAHGASVATFELESGAVASLHLVAASSQRIMAERTEVNGDFANVVVENNVRVVYARNPGFREAAGWGRGKQGWTTYGRDPDFTGEAADGYLVWEPEFSLGQLYNKALFLLGYFNEITQFCQAVLDKQPVEVGGIDYAEHGVRVFQAFKQGPGRIIDLRP